LGLTSVLSFLFSTNFPTFRHEDGTLTEQWATDLLGLLPKFQEVAPEVR
jgi:hypothetical protein